MRARVFDAILYENLHESKKGLRMIHDRIKKYCTVVLCICFLCYSASAKNTDTIKVGFTGSSIFLYEEYGSYYGFAYEYLIEIAKYTGWKYEFVKASKNECIEGLVSGAIDIFPGLQKTDKTEESALFPSRNVGSWPLMLYSLPDSTSFTQFNDFSQMNNLIIGIPDNDENQAILLKRCMDAGSSPVLKEYSNPMSLKQALLKKETDLIFYNSIHFDPDLHCIASFSPQDYFIAVSKKVPGLIPELNDALEEIQTKDPYYNADLHRKYYSSLSSAVHELSIDEKELIRADPYVKVTISSAYPPIDAADSIHGSSILMSILDLISDKTGLQFTYIIAANNTASATNLTEGRAQIIAALFNDFEWADARNIYLTNPVLPINLYEIYNKKIKTDNKTKLYALTKEYFDSGITPQTGNILVLPTMYECLKGVEKGKIDKTYANIYALLYHSQQNGFTNLTYDDASAVIRELCLGVSKNADRRILSILNKGINLISAEELQQVIYNNTILFNKKPSLKSFIQNSTIEFALFIVLFISILTAVIFLIILNHIRQQKNLALEKANNAKSEFLSRMSHEIRTPLTAIIGLNEMALEKKGAPEVITSYLEKIDISSRHLLQLINDILDMSKISEGKMYLRKAAFSLSGLLKALYVVYHPVAEKSNILLSIQKPADLPDTYIGDELRIKEILINLVSNAIKYNKTEGVVTLAVEQIPPGDKKQNITLRFTVSDTGIGIHKNTLDRIFEPFERDELADIKQIKGSGLGLSLSRKMLELMGSTIQVTSVPGLGSTFWFDLDLFPCNDEILKPQNYGEKPLCSLEGRRLIIAEDNDMNAEIIEEIIKNMRPSEYVRVVNGKECVSLFEQSPAGYYDTIIMDIRMPVMDGYKATKYIRSLNRADAKKVHIVALSANAYIEDVELSIEAGMNSHCSKPIDKQELQIALMAGG